MVFSRERILHLQSSGRVSTFLTVSITHPRTDLCVLQAPSPLRRFLRDIGSSLEASSLLLGRKRLSMARKICRVIFRCSVGTPWNIPMKSSKYTST